MKVEDYSTEAHYYLLAEWLDARGLYIPPIEETPVIGYVAYASGVPTAMAFLRRVEGNQGQLDGLVSNPLQPSTERSQAIDSVVQAILNRAKSLGIKQLLALSSHENTLLRSLKHGFVKIPLTVIAVDLKS